MRNSVLFALAGVCVCCAAAVWSVSAQPQEDLDQPADEAREDGPRDYLRITAVELEKSAKVFRDQYVELADSFGQRAPLPRGLRRYNVSSRTHVGFLTHPATGSNALCVVERDNEEAIQALATLVEESPIYLQGRVGPRIMVRSSERTLFMVDRMVRGHQAPQPPKVKETKKPVQMVVEVPLLDKDGRLVVGPNGQIRRRAVGRYTIGKPDTRYAIPDPYDSTRIIYLTLKY